MDFYQLYQRVVFLVPEPPLPNSNFAIITAHNPRGEILDNEKNANLNRLLCQRLQGTEHKSIIGCSLDLKHQEASFAVVCDKSQAIELARQFDQNAIYWVENGELWLIPAVLKWPPKLLGDLFSYIRR